MQTFADSIRTLLYVGAFFGVFPFYRKQSRIFERKIYTYALILMITSLLISIYAVEFATMETTDTSEIILYKIPSGLTALANIAAVFQINIFKFKTFKGIFERFNLIDLILIKIGCTIPKLKYTTIRLALIPLPGLLVGVYEISERLQTGKIPSNYHFYINARFQMFFTCFLVLFQRRLLSGFKKRLNVINGVLRKKNFLNSLPIIDGLIAVQDLVFDAIEDFNEIFGWSILLVLAQNFMGVLGVINGFLFNDYDWKDAVFSCFWNIYIAMQGILITRSCEHIIKESKSTISASYKCLQRFKEGPKPLQEKIFVLSQQSSNRLPVFSAAGFFFINYNMLFTLANMVTSYMIVLIQFENNKRFNDGKSFGNVTKV